MKKSMKYMAAALAAVTAMSCTTVPVSAQAKRGGDGDPVAFRFVNEVAGIQFESLEDLAAYTAANKGQSEIPDVASSISDWLLNADSLYIPAAFKDRTADIAGILITPTYVSTAFIISDVRYELYHYISKDAGNKAFEYAQFCEEKGRFDAHKVNYLGSAVYFVKYAILGEYYWTNDSEYYELRIYSTDGFSEDALDLCSAYKYPLSEAFSGWKTENGKSYYYRNGELVTKASLIDGVLYKFDKRGVCMGKYTGWAKSAGSRYYYKDGIRLKSCWIKVNGKRAYYLQKNGKMAVGTVMISGKSYTFGADGKLM